MFCTIRGVGWLLALIISSVTSVSAVELEGIVVQPPTVSVTVGNSVGIVPATNGLIPDKWNCTKRAGEVLIRRITLCWVLPGATVEQPAETSGVIRYRVLVEKGLDHLARRFANRVDQILGLDTGWARNGIRFARVAGKYDFTVLLANPGSVDRLCRPLRTRGWLSCAIYRGAVINATRWQEGAETWGDDVEGYHHYLVNHEVGHVLGLRHLKCPEVGAPAPIMLQQTIFLKGCTANGVATPGDLKSLMRAMPRIKRRFVGYRPSPIAQVKRSRPRIRRIRRSRVRKRRRSRRAMRKRTLAQQMWKKF